MTGSGAWSALHPAPSGPCSSSPVIKRAVALEPSPGTVRFSFSAFGDCILEQAGRTLRVSQAVANYALRHNCLGPGRGVGFPPEQQQQQWLHLSQARQTVGGRGRAGQTDSRRRPQTWTCIAVSLEKDEVWQLGEGRGVASSSRHALEKIFVYVH